MQHSHCTIEVSPYAWHVQVSPLILKRICWDALFDKSMALLQASHNLVPSAAAIAFFTDASCDELRSYRIFAPIIQEKRL